MKLSVENSRMPRFARAVVDEVEKILAEHEEKGGNLFLTVKPLVRLAMPELRKTLIEEPEKVYAWLNVAQRHINHACGVYVDERDGRDR